MRNEDTLISALISETYKEEAEKESTVVDLHSYFENRRNEVDHESMEKYLDQFKICHVKMVYLHEIKCYRMDFEQMKFDFPSNWSVFKDIESSDFIYLTMETDQDFLLDIFSEYFEDSKNIMIVNDETNVEMIFMSEYDCKKHVEWVKEYFYKKSEKRKAA